MKTPWTSWLLSLAVHAAVFGPLLLPSPKGAPEEVKIDLVTLGSPNSSSRVSAPAVRKRRSPSPKPAEDLLAKTEVSGPEAPAPPTDESTLEGDSDLEGLLASGRGPRNSKERYLAGLRDQIARHQAYPQASRSFGEEGTVKIRLTLNRGGSLLKVELIEASAHKRLNDAAMRAAARAAPYATFPNDVSYQTWKVLVPVRFTLAQR